MALDLYLFVRYAHVFLFFGLLFCGTRTCTKTREAREARESAGKRGKAASDRKRQLSITTKLIQLIQTVDTQRKLKRIYWRSPLSPPHTPAHSRPLPQLSLLSDNCTSLYIRFNWFNDAIDSFGGILSGILSGFFRDSFIICDLRGLASPAFLNGSAGHSSTTQYYQEPYLTHLPKYYLNTTYMLLEY